MTEFTSIYRYMGGGFPLRDPAARVHVDKIASFLTGGSTINIRRNALRLLLPDVSLNLEKHSMKLVSVALSATLFAGPAIAGVTAKPDPLHARDRVHYKAITELTAQDVEALRANLSTSIPTFTGSFKYGIWPYYYTMVGGAPSAGGTTTIPTVIQPIKFVFNGTTDPATGSPYVLDGTQDLAAVANSPNFQLADYSVGSAMQYSDAIQNAEFYSVRGANWHTVLAPPRVLPTVTINVPSYDATVYTAGNGTLYAKMNYLYFYGQLLSLEKHSGFAATEVPIVLTHDVVLYDWTQSNCCTFGFHNSYKASTGTQFIAWASWLSPGLFGGWADVTALSHELAELINDPTGFNIVPAWEFPGETKCQFNLETGDPVEVLANISYPVTIGTTTYHPQTEALLQWFERTTPSDAFDGAYSYPNTTALTTPAKSCGT
jgi:hypothetical protein